MDLTFVTARGLDGSVQGAGSPNRKFIAAFNATQIAGLVLLTAVILTAWLSPTVKRSIAWYNIIISWIFSAFSFSLLMGRQLGPEPPFGLCLFQSILIYAAPSMNACVCVCFAFELFFSVWGAANQGRTSLRWRLFIILLPYIIPFLICLEVLVLGLSHRDDVARNQIGMYCHLKSSLPSLITGAIVVFVMISVLPVVGVTIFMFMRNWSAFRQLRVRQDGGLPLRMVVRFSIFCILPLPIVTISLISMSFSDGGKDSAPIAVAIGTLPIMAALIFGTQSDILSVWMFWKHIPRPPLLPQVLPPVKPQGSEIELNTKPAISVV